tara:strand:- start:141281 stop:142117 length:837 start_codon:yes stop_codon:yes gene_type:complete
MNSKILISILLSLSLGACNDKPKTKSEVSEIAVQKDVPQTFQNKGHELVYTMVEKVGNYDTLSSKKDVVYTYTYTTPDGISDISTEKYIFDGELSYGEYKKHERTLSELEGTIEQGYDGSEFWLKHEGDLVNDTVSLKRVAFNRPTNFYWFAMFQKLLDPGLTYEYLGEKKVDKKEYDVVKITFISTNKKPTDIYQLYINRETGLVDQFLFTVVDFGVLETPYLMQVAYENIDGVLLPTKRKYKKSTWDAAVSDEPWIHVTWTDITFNNDLHKEDFRK